MGNKYSAMYVYTNSCRAYGQCFSHPSSQGLRTTLARRYTGHLLSTHRHARRSLNPRDSWCTAHKRTKDLLTVFTRSRDRGRDSAERESGQGIDNGLVRISSPYIRLFETNAIGTGRGEMRHPWRCKRSRSNTVPITDNGVSN